MAEYRVFCLDDDGHVVSGKEVIASNDMDALDAAHIYCNDFEVELWQRKRLVARVKKGNAALDALDRSSL